MTAHILIVEDERHIGVGVKYNLEAEGYRATLVEDGPTALNVIEKAGESIDLVVLDLMLPGMSGYTVCERLRDEGRTLPILMLSARTLAEDRTRGFDVGANQYMSKPFELDELLSRVKNLLQINAQLPRSESPVHGPRGEASFGAVHVNFDNHECRANGELVRLTSKEVRLLRYFINHPNRVISRSELLSEIWEVSGNLQTRKVDQFIARLRKIIEPNVASPIHLITIRDAGYRFDPHPDSNEDGGT